MNRILVSAGAVAVLGSVAQAGLTTETEANNSLATANDLTSFLPGSVLVEGSITPADVDWFEISGTAGGLIFAGVFDRTPGVPFDNDSMLALFDSGGVELAFNDDFGGSFMSQITFIATYTGTYYVALTGFFDRDFDGSGHAEDFEYKLVISSNIPSPGAMTLAGLGGLVAFRRRRA